MFFLSYVHLHMAVDKNSFTNGYMSETVVQRYVLKAIIHKFTICT